METSENTTYSAQAIANSFLELAESDNCTLTNMQLQKLVYIAHGIHLGMTGDPLTFNNIHAWQWGPVIPKLYKKLQKYGNGNVTGRLEAEDDVQNTSYPYSIIRHVWESYGKLTGGKLSTLTHLSGSPWDLTWNRDANKFGVIPVEMITSYYRERLSNAKR